MDLNLLNIHHKIQTMLAVKSFFSYKYICCSIYFDLCISPNCICIEYHQQSKFVVLRFLFGYCCNIYLNNFFCLLIFLFINSFFVSFVVVVVIGLCIIIIPNMVWHYATLQTNETSMERNFTIWSCYNIIVIIISRCKK